MSALADLVTASFSLLRIAALLLALWLAFRFESRIAHILNGQHLTSPSRLPRTSVWLALGAIFSIPMFDLTGLLRMLVEIISPSSWGLTYGAVPTFWGSAPSRVFDALSIGTTLVVYAAVSFPLWRYFRDDPLPAFHTLARSRADRILVIAASAGLVNLIVRSVVLEVVLIELPVAIRPIEKGIPGFAGAWLLGMLLALVLSQLFRLRTAASDAQV
jgi:hypothetical protein